MGHVARTGAKCVRIFFLKIRPKMDVLRFRSQEGELQRVNESKVSCVARYELSSAFPARIYGAAVRPRHVVHLLQKFSEELQRRFVPS